MRKLTQPWKLRRNLGVQPVGSVAGPRWPKAAIAAPIIPAQSSRRTFREGQSPTADLPIGKLDSTRSSDVSTTFNSKVGNCYARVSSGVTARCNSPQFSLSHWKQRGAMIAEVVESALDFSLSFDVMPSWF